MRQNKCLGLLMIFGMFCGGCNSVYDNYIFDKQIYHTDSIAELKSPVKRTFPLSSGRNPSLNRSSEMLIGKWRLDYVSNEKMAQIGYYMTFTTRYCEILDIKSDGTYEQTGDLEKFSRQSGKWTYRGNLITLTSGADERRYKLVWYTDDTFEARYADIDEVSARDRPKGVDEYRLWYDEDWCEHRRVFNGRYWTFFDTVVAPRIYRRTGR